MQKDFCNSIGHNQTHAPQQSGKVMRPFNAHIHFAAERRIRMERVLLGGGLDKLHREAIRDAPARGRTILNSVNSPGCVSTSIYPPCCLTMMS